MSGWILAILISLLFLQLLLWILIEIDVWHFADNDTAARRTPVKRVPEITIMIPFFGLIIQLWYIYSRITIQSNEGE